MTFSNYILISLTPYIEIKNLSQKGLVPFFSHVCGSLSLPFPVTPLFVLPLLLFYLLMFLLPLPLSASFVLGVNSVLFAI